MVERPLLSGKELCRLMRLNRVTIRELAARAGFAMKRIRYRREHGFGPHEPEVIRDWIEVITGEDIGPRPDILMGIPASADIPRMRLRILEVLLTRKGASK